MDDTTSRLGLFTEITVRIPDDLAHRLGPVGELERRAMHTLALEEFKRGHLTRPELARLLGFGTRVTLNEFLKAHDLFDEPSTPRDLEGGNSAALELDEESRAHSRQAAASIIARRKGVTLGGLSIEDLINEGRP
ncbi:MAG: hypothetical protein JO267_12150 [Alphaproteobacteria bacterium]|nr:hypothetical protein [Alphaproteobacteria bacterium]MBV9862885.1 hypothetical protein [Alphaproteobacteria bacterium]